MKPERRSETLLGVTRSKAKMFEFDVPEQFHIKIPRDPSRLFSLAIGMLGDVCARINQAGPDDTEVTELKQNLKFSAQFFDAFRQSRLDQATDPYLLLIGAASYYLCDLPGSAAVLARSVGLPAPDLGAGGLEELTLWLLRGDPIEEIEPRGEFAGETNQIVNWFRTYYSTGEEEDQLQPQLNALRRRVYDNSAPRQLLFADIACAIASLRRINSARYSLPRYSNLPTTAWLPFLQKSSIRELWPAQHLLGRDGVIAGRSAVVQMPTSAGKSRGTELIIRSCFLSRRTTLAVVVAPFRALCHEIRRNFQVAFADENVNVDELTDVFQTDFDIQSMLRGNQVLVVTPEKLLYVIRHNPELANEIGLIVYDEGHQFDNGTRGVTYELLLTSLKALIPKRAQSVLISAVISNAASINEWMTEGAGVVVAGASTAPTYRSLAFVSWEERLGQLQFVDPQDPEAKEFFVPRIIETLPLSRNKGESKKRVFPERSNAQSVALYLGLKLISRGSVAIFCGTKASAAKVIETAVDAFDRQVAVPSPLGSSNREEVRLLAKLYQQNLGEAASTKGARLGFFSHHGNTPHGIKLCVEYALKEALARFVVCTSTLAQGVNLPIRYLIITSTYQGADRIKVRDFHNLIGRAGRAGMYTEGSILFANPELYDERGRERWRWNDIKELLDPANSEPCASTLLQLFQPFKSDNETWVVRMEPLFFIERYINDRDQLLSRPKDIARRLGARGFTEAGLERQLRFKLSIIAAIESYLMAYWDDGQEGDLEPVGRLAEGTLAYHLADEERRRLLGEVFRMLAENLRNQVPDPSRRKVFGKLLYGVVDARAIQEWVEAHAAAISFTKSQEEMLDLLWPLLIDRVDNNTFRRIRPPDVLRDFCFAWTNGVSYQELLKLFRSRKVKIGDGKRPRTPQIEHVVELGEDALGFDGMLVIGAVAEVYGAMEQSAEQAVEMLHGLQRRIKYGLPSSVCISIYEAGFADRGLAVAMTPLIGEAANRAQVIRRIRRREERIRDLLTSYPSYFSRVLDSLTNA